MTIPSTATPLSIGLDDGYAFTKVALPDGRLVAVPSRAKRGPAGVTWLDEAEPRALEYETEGSVYAVGDIDGDPTRFEGYPFSGMNRAIVQHVLQRAGLAGAVLHAVSGLPVRAFYLGGGKRRAEPVERKRASLVQAVRPLNGEPPAGITFHAVIPEALAAWYDHVIVEGGSEAQLDESRLAVPIAVIDIGGRTTDFVVVADQGVVHGSSGSLACGLLDVSERVADGIREAFGLETLGERAAERAVATGKVKLFGEEHDVSALVDRARREVVERIHAETRRQLGLGAELERVLLVGGGAVALSRQIRDWFPNQQLAEHPAFANARGMLKYLCHVCDESAPA